MVGKQFHLICYFYIIKSTTGLTILFDYITKNFICFLLPTRIWITSYRCLLCGRNLVYKLLTVPFGIFIGEYDSRSNRGPISLR